MDIISYIKAKKAHEMAVDAYQKAENAEQSCEELQHHVSGIIDEIYKIRSPFLIAHRGFSSVAPENTLASLNAAIAEGTFKAIEFDVRVSSDGYFVVIHDSTVNRTTNGTGTVSGKTLAQLRELDAGSWFSGDFSGEKIPTLEEYLSRCLIAGLFPYIEIKSELTNDEAETLVAIIDAYGARRKVSVQSFSLSNLQKIRSLAPEITLAYHAEINSTNISAVKDLGNSRISPEYSTIDSAAMNMAKSNDIHVECYTVDVRSTARDLFEMGVIGINSNKLSDVGFVFTKNHWRPISLNEYYSGFGMNSGRPEYLKDPSGMVFLRGAVGLSGSGTQTNTIGQLPAECYPEYQTHLICALGYFKNGTEFTRTATEVRINVSGLIQIPMATDEQIQHFNFLALNGSFQAVND